MSQPTEMPLKRRIEEIALEWVADGAPDGAGLRALSEAFANVRDQAHHEGRPEVAQVAEALRGSVDSVDVPAGLARLNEVLKQGIEDLQAAVENTPGAGQPAANLLIQDRELVAEIVLESREHLASLEGHLLTLEHDPSEAEAVHATFRSFHTIKGLAGFLELSAIQQVAHEVESVLDNARNGTLAITPAVIDLVLAARDYLGRAFDGVESAARGDAGAAEPDNRALLERIRTLGADEGDSQTNPAPPGSQAAVQFQTPGASEPETRADESGPQREQSRSHAEARMVKVDTVKLDYLVDMVGEMVIAQSQIRHDPVLSGIDNPRLQRNLAQLARTTNELQRTAMAMRMDPIGQLFRRMIRLVRDLSRKAGKQAVLELSGEETELDRTIVEQLSDPLIHMIRNSMDHGLETADERRAAGKDPVGHIRLRACHQAGHILVEIADDGRGINKEKVLARARQKGIIAADARPSETEIFGFLFEPGFSTAERVSDVSGRGVGMDVVRKHIQKLRGRIDVKSTEGLGTTFLLKLPLTLAIIDGLVIGVGRERYIVPLFAVREMFRPTPDMLSSIQGEGEMVLIRGRLLPIFRLYSRLGVRPRTEDPCDAVFIVAENSGRQLAIMVDEFTGKQEVVIKSLGETMKNLPGIAGGTILGDGRVGLVLDLDGLFERSHV